MVSVDLAALRSIEREKEISFEHLLERPRNGAAERLQAHRRTRCRTPGSTIDRKTGEVVVWAQDLDADGAPDRGVRRHPDRLRPGGGDDRAPGDPAAIARRRARRRPSASTPGARATSSPASCRPMPRPRQRGLVLARHRQDRSRPAAVRAGAGRAVHPRHPAAGLRRRGRPAARAAPRSRSAARIPPWSSKLFALEVPEIADGSVEIVAVAREAGHRSQDRGAHRRRRPQREGRLHRPHGPAGAQCRRRTARREDRHHRLGRRSRDLRRQCAVAGARAVQSRSSTRPPLAVRVVVPDFQLSLAIGREGQNARLAARLTGLRIDIHSDAEGRPPRCRGRAQCGRRAPQPSE